MASFIQYISQWRQARLESFINKRIPASDSHTLDRKNIFILPNWSGLCYLAVCAAIYLLATNYESNLGLLLCYWLLGIFLVILYLSYFNLAGIKLVSSQTFNVHVEQNLTLQIQLISDKDRYSFCWQDGYKTELKKVNASHQFVNLGWQANQRGLFRFPRVRLYSTAPFGLFNVWTWLDFNRKTYVYPKPLTCPEYQFGTGRSDSGMDDSSNDENIGDSEFYGLKPYQLGEPLSRVAWKRASYNNEWQVKQFEQSRSDDVWFSLANVAGSEIEEKLSKLTWLLINAEQQNMTYGLELGHKVLQPQTGAVHLKSCLLALAKY